MNEMYGNVKNERMTALKSIRHFCIECQGGHYQPIELDDGTMDPPYMPYKDVKECPSETCWLHPYRTGRRPGKKVTSGKQGTA